MRAQFVLELHEDLKKVQLVGVSNEELRSFIEDIRKYLREDIEDLEKKQKAIGMKCLFRGFLIKAWSRTDFSDNKCASYDRIFNQHFMNYYFKCWKDRNEKLHD